MLTVQQQAPTEVPTILALHGFTGCWPMPSDVPWPATRVRAQRRIGAPMLGRPRKVIGTQYEGTILDLVELIERHSEERRARKVEQHQASVTVEDLVEGMSSWWSKVGRKTTQVRSLVRAGWDEEDVRSDLVETLIRRQQDGFDSKYDPTRLMGPGVDDPIDAYCGIMARGRLLHLLARHDRLALDESEDHTRSRESAQTSVWSEAWDTTSEDDKDRIGLRLDARRTSYSSDESTETRAQRDVPQVIRRRRG